MRAPTLGALAAPVTALATLTARFPDLPSVDCQISTIVPDELELVSHDNLAGFEAWRQALGIAPDSVVHGVQGGGTTHVLKAYTAFMGVRVRLVCFAPVAAPARAAEVAS
ncbi:MULTISPECIES: hypothetical protein [unclassified Streptomyces]|uniref:hypothetical protein n=1 Tax=unclassified Streptomyces TaxID=2593676 RepID=UPI000DAC905B|nr:MULTISPECIES: hypothetical protein [unclassified Streptomyces]PZT75132.1 hypothetical protein DNK55_24275 [Streptomyces sp. AC1-42T]PZT81885.1 hypothetical protein DNK56_07170 [Streptomyces sp. AC1-42W]